MTTGIQPHGTHHSDLCLACGSVLSVLRPAGPLRWCTAPVRQGGEGRGTERPVEGMGAAQAGTAARSSGPVGESL
jgi:hypothetical protein